MLGQNRNEIKLLPVLPNLVTTTDEVTIFATAGTVHAKEQFYIVARPDEVKNEKCHSGGRNHYSTKRTGDAHCRGVRIVINSTFTAGGLSAPIFICMYGLTSDEMPNDDMIHFSVPGFVSGSHQNLYSEGSGIVVFVKGGDHRKEQVEDEFNADSATNTNNRSSSSTESTRISTSKESKVAQLYKQEVYYPFIKKICKDKYNFDEEDSEIPNHLRAVSWMDGCASQLKLITSDSNMQVEKKLKITCCKHSASRTAVEQAADTGAMFKEMKRIVNNTENPHSSNNSVFQFIEQRLIAMENGSTAEHPDMPVLKLQNHKKKAILSTAAKLPIATACAYSDNIIKTAFIVNGQIDLFHKLVPSLTNLLNTYRGNFEMTNCFKNKENLIEMFYEEAFTTGMVSELTLDKYQIPTDMNFNGEIVSRDVGIQLENRQRSKVLSCQAQIQARYEYLFQTKMKEHKKTVSLFNAEDKTYNDNEICETKILRYFTNGTPQQTNISTNSTSATENQSTTNGFTSFNEIADILRYDEVTKYRSSLLKDEMLCFVQVRSEKKIRSGKISYLNVPKNKPEIFESLWKLHNAPIKPRLFPTYPSEPQRH